MEHPVLTAAIRQVAKSENKRLKRENKLPAVVYGKGYETTSIAIDEKELSRILKTRGESSLINLEVEDQTFPVLIKEVQRNTLKNSIDHVDFFKVSMDEEVEYNLHIVLVGDAEGIKMGGVLQHQKREVTVKSLPGDMLDSIEVDVSTMDIGDTLTVADLKVDDKNTILDDPNEVVVTLLAPAIEEEEEDVETPEEGEEPELVESDNEEEKEEK
jgi:large subunit ribosomal protein L25